MSSAAGSIFQWYPVFTSMQLTRKRSPPSRKKFFIKSYLSVVSEFAASKSPGRKFQKTGFGDPSQFLTLVLICHRPRICYWLSFPMRPVIFDTDIGTDVDDILALVLLAKAPDLRLI